MADQRLVDYIRNGLEKGYSAQSLRSSLIKSGWHPDEVDEAVQKARGDARVLPAAPSAPVAKMGVFSKMKMILISPTEFFEAAKYDHIGDALKYYAIMLIIPVAIMAAIALAAPNIIISALSSASAVGGAGNLLLMLGGLLSALMVGMIIAMYFAALVGTFITAGIYHIIALLFGARKSYGETYKAIIYASTPFLLIGWLYVPLVFINIYLGVAALIVISIWALMIMVKGLSILQGISGKRAAAIILLPIAVVLVLTIGLAAVSWMYMGNMMQNYAGKSFSVAAGGAYCDETGIIHVMVVNTGTAEIAQTDWLKKEAKSGSVVIPLAGVSLPTRSNGELTATQPGVSGTTYNVSVATVSGSQTLQVVCL